jgi:hypothetical protein
LKIPKAKACDSLKLQTIFYSTLITTLPLAWPSSAVDAAIEENREAERINNHLNHNVLCRLLAVWQFFSSLYMIIIGNQWLLTSQFQQMILS